VGEHGTEPSVNGAILQRPHQGHIRKRRNNRIEALHQRAAAEVCLIVHLYLEGLSFRKIAARLSRDRWYVANVFYSPIGQHEAKKQKTSRELLAEQLNDNVLYAAQRALDEIIALSANAESEVVRLKASECIVKKALEDGKPGGTNVQVNVSDDALRLAINTLEEINAMEKPSDDTDSEH
jgi:hypothetical protein